MELLTNFKIEMLLNIYVYLKDYWYLGFSIFLTLFLIIRFLPIVSKEGEGEIHLFSFCILLIFLKLGVALLLLLATYSPYRPDYKLNGVLERVLVSLNYKKVKECRKLFLPHSEILQILKKNEKHFSKKTELENVILFIIESLSRDYVSLMPFLTEKAKEGLFLRKHLSTTSATSLAINHILTSQKNWGDYSNPLHTLLKFNYHTSFYFGDRKRTFRLDRHLARLGIHNYLAKEDYLKETGRKDHIDKEGNILEEPFLSFTGHKIKESDKKPFFSVILTNQLHSPFYCPNGSYSNQKERKENCIKYIDKSLKSFFKLIEKETWFNKTLFVFTGDHTDSSGLSQNKRQNYFYKHNVPLIFYHPVKNLKRFQNDEVSSHIDIMPSLLDYLGLSQKTSLIHHSVFDLKNKRRIIGKKGDSMDYILLQDDYFAQYECETGDFKVFKGYPENKIPVKDPFVRNKYINLLKASIQYLKQ